MVCLDEILIYFRDLKTACLFCVAAALWEFAVHQMKEMSIWEARAPFIISFGGLGIYPNNIMWFWICHNPQGSRPFRDFIRRFYSLLKIGLLQQFGPSVISNPVFLPVLHHPDSNWLFFQEVNNPRLGAVLLKNKYHPCGFFSKKLSLCCLGLISLCSRVIQKSSGNKIWSNSFPVSSYLL